MTGEDGASGLTRRAMLRSSRAARGVRVHFVAARPVSPPAHPVTIALYKVVHGRRRLVASKRIAATDGQFQHGFGTRGAGRYVVIAQTPASARYAAASSAPLTLTI